MRAALGLALAFGGGALALYVLSGHVPLSGAPSAPVSGGTAQTGSGQAEPLNRLATNATAGTALSGLFGGAGGMP